MKERSLSVIARCPDTGDLGAAVISSFPAIGAYTPLIKKGAGIIAIQGWFYPALPNKGLMYLEQGMTANLTLDKLLTHPDGTREYPIAVLDDYGNGAAYSGVSETEGVSDHIIGKQYALQGQGLLDAELLHRMKERFETSSGELGNRILDTMNAVCQGKEDCTHYHSGILTVARDPAIPFFNIRVDDHDRPVVELKRVYNQNQEKLRRRFLKSLGESGMVT